MSIVKRNYQNSRWLGKIADVLGVTVDELRRGENYERKRLNKLQKMGHNVLDIKWLFESLSECNQKAVLHLIRALFMAERSPEIFDNDLYEEC